MILSEIAQLPKVAQAHRAAPARARGTGNAVPFSRDRAASSQGPGPEASVLLKVKGVKLQASCLWPWYGKGPEQVYLEILTLDPGRKDHDTAFLVCVWGMGGGVNLWCSLGVVSLIAWCCLGWLDTKPQRPAHPVPSQHRDHKSSTMPSF